MGRYLLDVNLPYYFRLWHGPDYIHLKDLNDEEPPPPRVIHIRFGNLKMRDFHERISGGWAAVCELSARCRIVHIFEDRIEGIE